MNKYALKGFIAKNADTQEQLAAALGISVSCLSAKINNKGTSFRQNEIAAIKARYHMTAEEVDEVFFAK